MIRQIEQDIIQKYGVAYVRVIHRIGALGIGGTAIIAEKWLTQHIAVKPFKPVKKP